MFGLKHVLVVAPFFVLFSHANAEDSLAAMTPEEAIRDMDSDGDGALSLDEITNGEEEAEVKTMLEELFTRADKNENGQLDSAEIQAFLGGLDDAGSLLEEDETFQTEDMEDGEEGEDDNAEVDDPSAED